jgi:hypothetical protein
VLPGETVKHSFPKALAFLSDKRHLESGAVLSWYRLPFNHSMPLYVLVFRKKNLEAKLPSYMMSFYFNNYILNMPLLMNEQDSWSDGQCDFVPPPYFPIDRFLEIPILFHPVKDFASTEKVTDEWEDLIITEATA